MTIEIIIVTAGAIINNAHDLLVMMAIRMPDSPRTDREAIKKM